MKIKKIKLVTVLLCLVLLTLFTISCGNNDANNGANNNGEQKNGANNGADNDASKRDSLSLGVTADDGTLDATQVQQDAHQYLLGVMEPLWEIDLDGTINPKLAESWEWVSDDHMKVHLRKGITFSNGNPLTAEDVLFTMGRYKEGGWAGVPRVQTTDFERTKIIDEYTIDWYLNAPSVLHWTVPSDMLIFDKESFDEETAATRPIGTGPYVVTEYVVNSHIKITRRDDYWGELPAIKDFTFRVLAEPSQRVNALETGLVDVVPIALADVEHVRSLPNYQIKNRPGQSWLAMGFNISQDGLLANPEARYAIMHAIDRQAICDIVYYGLAKVMNSPITKAALDYEDRFENMHDIYAIGYDLELAKELAEKSGLVGKTLRLINNGTAEHVAACEMVQNMLEKIGVAVEIHSYDPASFTDVQQDKNAYEISLRPGICPNLRVGDPMVNAIINNQIWKIPENWANSNGPRYFELMRKSLSTLDDKARGDILYELLQYYIETSPTYAICSFDQFTAYTVDLDLSNYRDRAIGSYYVYGFKFK